MIYAITVIPKVQPSHTVQWISVFVVKCLDPWRRRRKMYFAGNYKIVSFQLPQRRYVMKEFRETYMNDKRSGDYQSRKSEAVAHFLYHWSSRPKSRRGNVRSTVDVYHTSNNEICHSHYGLASKKRTSISSGVPHFGHNREKSRCAGIRHDECRYRSYGFREGGCAHHLIIRHPNTILWSGGGTILNANRDSNREY